jgi:hypothetical protein
MSRECRRVALLFHARPVSFDVPTAPVLFAPLDFFLHVRAVWPALEPVGEDQCRMSRRIVVYTGQLKREPIAIISRQVKFNCSVARLCQKNWLVIEVEASRVRVPPIDGGIGKMPQRQREQARFLLEAKRGDADRTLKYCHLGLSERTYGRSNVRAWEPHGAGKWYQTSCCSS